MTDPTPPWFNGDFADSRGEKAAHAFDFVSELSGFGELYPRDMERIKRFLDTDKGAALTERLLVTKKIDPETQRISDVTTDLECSTIALHALAHFFEEHPKLFGDEPVQKHMSERLVKSAQMADELLATWDDRRDAITGHPQTPPAAGSFTARYQADDTHPSSALKMANMIKVERQLNDLLAFQKETMKIFHQDEAEVLHQPHHANVMNLHDLATKFLGSAKRELQTHREELKSTNTGAALG